MASEMCKELEGVGLRLKGDDMLHSGDIVVRAAKRMAMMESLLVTAREELLEATGGTDLKNLKILIATGYDILNQELLPNIGGIAVQDYARLNEFMIDAGMVKQEIERE